MEQRLKVVQPLQGHGHAKAQLEPQHFAPSFDHSGQASFFDSSEDCVPFSASAEIGQARKRSSNNDTPPTKPNQLIARRPDSEQEARFV